MHPIPDRFDEPRSTTPVPFNLRPPSNHDWRSNPFRLNGKGNESSMLSGVDSRFAYWMGRWVKQ